MEEFIIKFDKESKIKLYEQIYERFKNDIESGEIEAGSKMPSLRKLAKVNDISITTVESAYNQLLLEGYIESRPKSGYYVNSDISPIENIEPRDDITFESNELPKDDMLLFDEESFDFYKWKRSMNKVFNNYSRLLRSDASPEGEQMLREEIASYLRNSRGLISTPDNIVIAAGSMHLTNSLIRILKKIGVRKASTEFPGYDKINRVFECADIELNKVGISGDIEISEMGSERQIVYINPSNRYPSGDVMPVSKRIELIKWADETDSYIIEDDYDSELRYFGKPVPPMKMIGDGERVIYYGSFSATLFAGINISYMVLPDKLMLEWKKSKDTYVQTCSKTEQLCLALYMRDGSYEKTIKKCRKIYSAKLKTTIRVFKENGNEIFTPVNSMSGMALTLRVKTSIPAEELALAAKRSGMLMEPVEELCTEDSKVICFYFYRVSETMLKILIKQYIHTIKRIMERGAADGQIK